MRRLLARAVFFLAGVFMVGLAGCSVHTLLTQPPLEAAQRAQASIAHWILAEGILDEVRIQQDVLSHPTNWHPSLVRYRFTVSSKEYFGDRLARNDYAYDAPELAGVEAKLEKTALLSGVPKQGPTVETAKMSHLVYEGKVTVVRYFPAKAVQVYYDPSDPASSILDNTDTSRPIVWMDYVGGPLFMAYLLGGFGLLAMGFAIPYFHSRLWGGLGAARYNAATQTYQYDSVTPLQSAVFGHVGFLFLLIASMTWEVNLHNNSSTTPGQRVFLWPIAGLSALIGLAGLFSFFVRRRTLMNGATHLVTAQIRIGPVFGLLSIQKMMAYSDFASVRLRLSRYDGTTRNPSYVTSEIALIPKKGRSLVLRSSKYPAYTKKIPQQDLDIAQGWAKAMNLRCEVLNSITGGTAKG